MTDSDNTILNFTNLGWKKPNADGEKSWVFRGISNQIVTGQIVALRGPNGCGKTSLLEVLAGWRPATDGDVHRPAKRVMLVPAEPRIVFFPWYTLERSLQAYEVFAVGCGCSKAILRDRREQLVTTFGLETHLCHFPHELSRGYRARGALACALLLSPKVMLLDEILSSMDQASKSKIAEFFLHEARENGLAIVIVSHEDSPATAMADTVWQLDADTPDLHVYHNDHGDRSGSASRELRREQA
jgi:NitT/TauT family transport system ATP-binding protein